MDQVHDANIVLARTGLGLVKQRKEQTEGRVKKKKKEK